MEAKSIKELNEKVQNELIVEIHRPKPLADQDAFNSWILGHLNELALVFSKGKRKFEVTDENHELFSAVFAYLNRSENDQLLMYQGRKLELEKGLLLMGNYGIGKTLLLTCIFQQRQKLELTGRFCSAQQVFNHNKKHLEELIGKDQFGLFLDDIGEEPNVANDFGTKETPVGNVIKQRVNAWERLPESPKLFMSTNCTEEVLKQVYGGRIVSRTFGACNVLVSKQKTDYRKV